MYSFILWSMPLLKKGISCARTIVCTLYIHTYIYFCGDRFETEAEQCFKCASAHTTSARNANTQQRVNSLIAIYSFFVFNEFVG